MLVDVKKLDLSLELLGRRSRCRFYRSDGRPPAGASRGRNSDGESRRRGKDDHGGEHQFKLSIDKIGAAATGPFWFQLHAGPEKDGTRRKWSGLWARRQGDLLDR